MKIDEKTQNKNLEFWNSVEKTDPSITKKVEYGTKKFTAIDAQSQFKNVTKQFGMYGVKWGIKNEKYEFIHQLELLVYTGILWYTTEQKEINLSLASAIKIRNKSGIDSDCIKKVRTDAFTKEISRLGFNADVFMGKFDDNKYVESMEQAFSSKKDNNKITAIITPIDTKKHYLKIDAEKSKADFEKFKISIDIIRQEISDELYKATLKRYQFESIDDVTSNFDRIALYRTLRSYTNKDTATFMLETIDTLHEKVGTEFFTELFNSPRLKVNDLEDLQTKNHKTVSIVYRATIYKANLIDRTTANIKDQIEDQIING